MNKAFLLILIGFIIFLSGCAKPKPTEVLYKNDVVTIENLVVDTLAPYSEKTVNIEFDVQSNADKPITKITVNFFDTPGFVISKLECPETKDRICEYTNVESLDSRHVNLQLTANKVESPTPFTVSFSVKYDYDGKREAVIPVINPLIRKEPVFKFSQSEPTIGPIAFDIQPLLEREKIVDDKIIKEYWAIKGNEFTTKFILKDIGTVKDKILPINLLSEAVNFTLVNLEPIPCEHFDTQGKSKIPVNKTFNTLICTFKPDFTLDEFTGIIKLDYKYSYEFIRSVNFVVQPLR